MSDISMSEVLQSNHSDGLVNFFGVTLKRTKPRPLFEQAQLNQFSNRQSHVTR